MDSATKNALLWIFGLLALFLFLTRETHYNGQTAEEWADEAAYWYSEAENTQEALDQANRNIEDAKYYAWESYDEMGEALDYLETVEP